MIIGATGHTGSGKTSFILRCAVSFGREGIVVLTGQENKNKEVQLPEPNGFHWKTVTADIELPALLDRINRESNVFRADRRVVVVKGVSGYLSACHSLLQQAGAGLYDYKERMNAYRTQLERAVLSYQGMLLIITDEPASITPFMSEQECCYHKELAAFNRNVAKHSHQWFWVSSGMAVDLRERKSTI